MGRVSLSRRCCICDRLVYSNDTVPFCDDCNPYRKLVSNPKPEGEKDVTQGIIRGSSESFEEDWYSTL